jgi:AcrR family transcriptional regulator
MKPGPEVGTSYLSADENRSQLLEAALEIIASGVPVHLITAMSVTQRAKVDKMYVNRYFGTLDHLLLAVVEDLLSNRLTSLIGKSIFNVAKVNESVEFAFRIAIHLANNPEMETSLREFGVALVELHSRQLREEFSLDTPTSIVEARIGLLILVGYLTIGHLVPFSPNEVDKWIKTRHTSLDQPKK